MALGESSNSVHAGCGGCAAAALLIALGCGGAAGARLPDPAAAMLTDPVFTPPGFCRDAIRVDRFDWLPADLPLPPDTFAVRDIPPSSAGEGVHAGLFVTPGSIGDVVDFVADSWSRRGWKAGWGEREAGEAEGTYFAADRFAAFRVGACSAAGSALLIVTGESR